MRPGSVVVLLTMGALAGGAAPASGAELRVDRDCFADPGDRADTVVLSGRGFTPGAAYRVTLDGRPLVGGTGRVDATGAVGGAFAAPEVGANGARRSFRLGVQEGVHRPTTTFTVSRLLARFAPTAGNPATLRVVFRADGFGLRGDTRPSVYVHYLTPRGRLARTVRLGTATGPCGSLRTARRRLFAFRPAPGRWRLQFDTRSRYTPGTGRSSFVHYTVPVRVG